VGDRGALLLGLALLAANAFFVGAEFALISARRTQLEPRAAAGSRAARVTLQGMEQVSLVMAGAQLGITACSLGLGAVAEPALAHLIEPLFHDVGLPEAAVHPVAFVLALTVVVALHVVLGEMVPKNIALAGPDRAALLLGPPMMVVVRVLKPVVVGLNFIANRVLRLFGVEPRSEVASTFTRDEVESLVQESRAEGLLEDDEYDRLAGALGFTERTVAAVVLPVSELVTLPTGCPLDQVEERCAETGFSRFPVVDEDGELAGYVHVKDVLSEHPQPDERLEDKWVRPFATVRPTHRLHEALAALRRRGSHLGRVVDDEGRISGIVTLEDVIEELVGEIRDAAHS
jgi:CBS domain containing-hemolysin-like protein